MMFLAHFYRSALVSYRTWLYEAKSFFVPASRLEVAHKISQNNSQRRPGLSESERIQTLIPNPLLALLGRRAWGSNSHCDPGRGRAEFSAVYQEFWVEFLGCRC